MAATSASGAGGTNRRSASAFLIAIVLLSSAAPAGAALPEPLEGICDSLDVDANAIFVGRPRQPAEFHVSFEDKFESSRKRWLTAQAEADKSTDIEVHRRAVDAHEEYEHLRNLYPELGSMVLIPVDVETIFKGAVRGTTFLQHLSPEPLEPGRRYLFIGSYFMPLELDDRIINGRWARPVDDAVLELRLVQEALAATYGGTVIGSIGYESPADPAGIVAPAGGVSVRVTSAGFIFDTTTDEAGIFLVTGVPPGPVRVAPALPGNMTVADPKPASGTLSEGHCLALTARVALNGRIRGRVIGRDGKPRANLSLELVPVDFHHAVLDKRGRANTNERGEFEFRAIPPGSYLLGHQIIAAHTRITEAGQDLPKETYYPGTSDRASALPIVVGNATLHDGLDFIVVW